MAVYVDGRGLRRRCRRFADRIGCTVMVEYSRFRSHWEIFINGPAYAYDPDFYAGHHDLSRFDPYDADNLFDNWLDAWDALLVYREDLILWHAGIDDTVTDKLRKLTGDFAALFQAWLDAPWDDAPRLIFSDKLQESGDDWLWEIVRDAGRLHDEKRWKKPPELILKR